MIGVGSVCAGGRGVVRRRSAFAVLAVGTACCIRRGGAQYDGCTNGSVADVGNGRCDAVLNTPECGFDGGDCCPCTCSDSPDHSCSDNDFDCLFPKCEVARITSEGTSCEETFYGDGYCDPANNTPSCQYDGGDCCACTCVDSFSYTCNANGFQCRDPACFEPATAAEYPLCTSGWLTISDGFCDHDFNTPECGYDGGDCCVCTCVGTACSRSVPVCLDPDAYEEFDECQAPPPAVPPCAAGVQKEWVVATSAQARALTEAVRCSGGDFEAEWIGSVLVEEPIYLVGGTILNVSGADSSAVINGAGSTRLFTVVNASLYLSGLNLTAGASVVGGAVAATGSVLTIERTNFFLNEANGSGGAVYVSDRSTVSCVASSFANNTAALDGGAMYVSRDSTVSCGGLWINNEARDSGGALCVFEGSRAFWSEETTFKNNYADRSAGAVYILGSSATWDASTLFVLNTAGTRGGALLAVGSDVSWSGKTAYYDNWSFDLCGAVCASEGSSVSWSGITDFVDNHAESSGGSFYILSANVSWSAPTVFSSNSAGRNGGVISMVNQSNLEWTGETEFTSNYAGNDGGAFAFEEVPWLSTPQDSNLTISGMTTFSNNTCGANGGALALLGACSVSVSEVGVSFVRNTAAVAGGAVFVSSTLVGPVFSGVSFTSNSAQVGGALSMFGSGNFQSLFGEDFPSTIDRCVFVGNEAAATGGAIDSAAGTDLITMSVFEANKANVGGALRLAGSTSVESCSFEENVSGDRGGPAVSNIGSISSMTDVSFLGNVFECAPGMFRGHTTSSDPYEAACDGCPTSCDGCSFGPSAPACLEAVMHTTSAGGNATLAMLNIEPGYWRATPHSPFVMPCYNKDACLGGVTGSAGYCLEGYKGPYCAICSEGYTPQLGVTCSKCADSASGVAVAVVLSLAALVIALGVVSYLLSGEGWGKGRGLVERFGRYVPLQSIKIVIVAFQILTQFASVANVTYPAFYQRFLDVLEVLNFDLSWAISASCIVDVDFHDRLLIATITPLSSLLFLGAVYAVVARVKRSAPEALQKIWNKHVSLVLLLTFLVYSSVSAILFKAFACEPLDDGKYYLRADYRIQCDSPKHRSFMVYAGFMIVVYTVGIPAFYGGLLFKNRGWLTTRDADRGAIPHVASISSLWKPYRPPVFYYEVVECIRRFMLAGVVVFIYPNSAAQIAVTLLMAFFFVVIAEGLAPYESRWDSWLARMGHATVTLSMYVALLLKVDVSDEQPGSQRLFEVILVAAHSCMLVVIMVETAVQGALVWVERRHENPTAKFEAEGNPFSGDIYVAERGQGGARQQPCPSPNSMTADAGDETFVAGDAGDVTVVPVSSDRFDGDSDHHQAAPMDGAFFWGDPDDSLAAPAYGAPFRGHSDDNQAAPEDKKLFR